MSYKYKIIFGFVLLTSMIEAIIISYDISIAYQLRKDFLNQRSQLIVQTYSQTLKIPIWNLDQDTSESILKNILLDPDIIEVELAYQDNIQPKIKFSKNNKDRLDKESLQSKLITQSNIIEPHGDKTIASLTLVLSKQRLYQFLSERKAEGLIQFAILLLINFFLAYLLINWITTPLLKLSKAIRRLASNELDILIPYTRRNDEIGQVAQSITVLQKNNLELDELRASMESKITEQTKDLTIAKEKAEEATIAKSQFLATMSHEIRTPLNGVLGMAHILNETKLNKEQQESVNTIVQSGQDLIVIINEILDFSKLDAEQVKLEQISFNLRQLIKDLGQLLNPSLSQKKLNLIVEYGDDCPDFFIGDPVRVRQVLLNLLSNAIKFTQTGSITIAVQYQWDARSFPPLDIKVIDTGIGITNEQKKGLFKAFTQADQSTTRKYGGTGLGLSIVRKLVELMKGYIEIDSKPNIGSTFTLRLKLFADEQGLKQPQTDSLTDIKSAIVEEDNPLLKNKILLVEDNLVNQKIALIMLKKLGFNVELAVDGQQAITLWQENNYPFIYMDCLMPVMDGYQATVKIRAMSEEQPIIVALTANAMQSDVEKCQASGMDDIVTKPFKKEDLIHNLNKWGKYLKSLSNKEL